MGRRINRRNARQQNEAPRQSGIAPMPDVLWIRDAIREPLERLLRILIYARYSTDDQNPHSIDAQIAYCKLLLRALGLTDYELVVIKDVELSGELKKRPGIDQVWIGIEARQWDLILVEDASRLYRHDSWAVDLVYRAVDKQTRVICINDSVDTADDQRVWIPRLKDATRIMLRQMNTLARIRRQYRPPVGPRGGDHRAATRLSQNRDHAGPRQVGLQKDRFSTRSTRNGLRKSLRPLSKSLLRIPLEGRKVPYREGRPQGRELNPAKTGRWKM